MRLLHTSSGNLREFYDSDIPRYAILSHRWSADEVSFQEWEASTKKSGEGYTKIQRCCAIARSRSFDWAWIDTCCIDKKSSAELSEAINSMYRWYRNASECYAYLNDVTWVEDGTEGELGLSREALRYSQWFTRGWTLQELLAPKWMLFFDRSWTFMGLKSSSGVRANELALEISSATGIDVGYLRGDYWVQGACAAVKMSWLSRRRTSRSEDMAYCMLGLFGVNMPLLYGEGGKAFFRLQSEIIRQSEDESIFAWVTGPESRAVPHRDAQEWTLCPVSQLLRAVRKRGMSRRGETAVVNDE